VFPSVRTDRSSGSLITFYAYVPSKIPGSMVSILARNSRDVAFDPRTVNTLSNRISNRECSWEQFKSNGARHCTSTRRASKKEGTSKAIPVAANATRMKVFNFRMEYESRYEWEF